MNNYRDNMKVIVLLSILVMAIILTNGSFTESSKKSQVPKTPVASEKTASEENFQPGSPVVNQTRAVENNIPKPVPCTSCNGTGICGSCGGNGKGIGGKTCSFCNGKITCWSCKDTGKRG